MRTCLGSLFCKNNTQKAVRLSIFIWAGSHSSRWSLSNTWALHTAHGAFLLAPRLLSGLHCPRQPRTPRRRPRRGGSGAPGGRAEQLPRLDRCRAWGRPGRLTEREFPERTPEKSDEGHTQVATFLPLVMLSFKTVARLL